MSESELEMAERHVAQGERHIAFQEALIVHLRELGSSTVLAEELLSEFRTSLTSHRAHRDRIAAAKD
jgi:hypothetical protein